MSLITLNVMLMAMNDLIVFFESNTKDQRSEQFS